MNVPPLTAELERAILAGISVGVFVVDSGYTVLSWNGFMEHNSALPAAQVVGRNLFEVFPELPRAWLERKIRSVFMLANYGFVSWRQRPYLFAFPHNRPVTGGVAYMQQDCTLIPLRDASGGIAAVCITLVDATDACLQQQETERSAALLRNAMAELERLSECDGLTGVWNRRSLDRRLADEFKRYARYGSPFSILLFDLDHFKKVNDHFGHLGGDEVLRALAHRIGGALRDTDAFGRYGGEEFMIIMPSTSREEALVAGERFRRLVASAPVPFDNSAIDVTISVGVCEAGTDTPSATDVIHHADVALYACKARGRNCVVAHETAAISSAA